MARDNQGLHIALIVLFMLTIVLGVATYLFCSQYLEQKEKATKLQTDLAAVERANHDIQGFNNEMKKWVLGVDGAEALEPLRVGEEVQADMEKYSAGYDGVTKAYRPLLANLYDLVNRKNAELTDANEARRKLQSDYDAWKAEKEKQIEGIEVARKAAEDALKAATRTFDASLAQISAGRDQIQGSWDKAREETGVRLASLETERDGAMSTTRKLEDLVERQGEELDILKGETIEVPDGEIRWVDQRGGTVWINLGSADGLRQQATFSVYPMDLTNLAKASKKAGIEVTQIRGEHLAEARIIEDDVTNPIMLGDKVYTPVWNPGESVRFALVGLMDIDGDGKSDVDQVRELITTGGGKVDCVVDQNGKREGAMTIATQYLVVDTQSLDVKEQSGEGKAAVANVQASVYSAVIDEARRLAIKKVTLGDMLRTMGWKDRTRVVRYGRDADSRDFQPRSPEGVAPVSSGSVSDLFQPRRAPVGELAPRGGAY